MYLSTISSYDINSDSIFFFSLNKISTNVRATPARTAGNAKMGSTNIRARVLQDIQGQLVKQVMLLISHNYCKIYCRCQQYEYKREISSNVDTKV